MTDVLFMDNCGNDLMLMYHMKANLPSSDEANYRVYVHNFNMYWNGKCDFNKLVKFSGIPREQMLRWFEGFIKQEDLS